MAMTSTILPATLADSTLNLSSLRAPLTSSHAPSMADSLPSVNFGFDALRAHMASFTSRFDEHIERSRKRVLDERNTYRGMIADVNDQNTTAQRSLVALKQKTSSHTTLLSSQSTETAEMEQQIESLTKTRDSHAETVASLQSKLRTQRAALQRRRVQSKERSQFLEEQRAADERELAFWADHLALRIEGGSAEDRVRFVFGLNSAGGRREEASFELDMSHGSYDVIAAVPKIDPKADTVERLCREMADMEDLGAFLKGMRTVFLDLASGR